MHIDAVEYVASDANLSDEPSRLKLDTLERIGATQVVTDAHSSLTLSAWSDP